MTVCGKSIGAQGFGILPRVAAVDALMTPALQAHVHEGHPELTFATIAGRFLAHPKTRKEGIAERMAILADAGLQFDPIAERKRLGCSWMEVDDVIDAAAMLLTGMRIEAGRAVRVPATEQRDGRGLRGYPLDTHETVLAASCGRKGSGEGERKAASHRRGEGGGGYPVVDGG